MAAEIGGGGQIGDYAYNWTVTTNQQNNRATITATQTRVSTNQPAAGGTFQIMAMDDQGNWNTYDLWALNVVNQGPVQFNVRSMIRTDQGIDGIPSYTVYGPPTS